MDIIYKYIYAVSYRTININYEITVGLLRRSYSSI